METFWHRSKYSLRRKNLVKKEKCFVSMIGKIQKFMEYFENCPSHCSTWKDYCSSKNLKKTRILMLGHFKLQRVRCLQKRHFTEWMMNLSQLLFEIAQNLQLWLRQIQWRQTTAETSSPPHLWLQVLLKKRMNWFDYSEYWEDSFLKSLYKFKSDAIPQIIIINY